MAKRKSQVIGKSNETRTVNYLAKYNWIAVKSAGSAGMADIDVLAYHIVHGLIKHIQCKSHGSYTKKDLESLQHYRRMIKARSVNIELWNWLEGKQHPIIKVIEADEIHTISLDPKLVKIGAAIGKLKRTSYFI